MKQIIIKDGKFKIPEGVQLTKEKKRLVIRTPWSSSVDTLNSYGQITTQQWFRSKFGKDKPYVPEGFVEIDGERYEVIDGEKK